MKKKKFALVSKKENGFLRGILGENLNDNTQNNYLSSLENFGDQL